jgi:hypothetical protein
VSGANKNKLSRKTGVEPKNKLSRGVACVGVLDRPTKGVPEVVDCAVEDRDQETENSKVCARTRDTRFIQVRAAKEANPTSFLGDQVWRPALGVGFRSGSRLGTRPSFI